MTEESSGGIDIILLCFAAGVDDSGDSESEDEDLNLKEPLAAQRGEAAARKTEKESKAAEEISALVNYVQAVRFHGFESAESESVVFNVFISPLSFSLLPPLLCFSNFFPSPPK